MCTIEHRFDASQTPPAEGAPAPVTAGVMHPAMAGCPLISQVEHGTHRQQRSALNLSLLATNLTPNIDRRARDEEK